jgi:LPXTG-site transpeptidase (sortase) family protein
MTNQNKKGITSLPSRRNLLRSLFLSLMIFSLLLLTPAGVHASSLSKPLYSLGWVGNMSPSGTSPISLTAGNDFTVTVEVFKFGVTDAAGQGANIDCTLHWAPVAAFGDTWGSSTDTPMTYNSDTNNNDLYMATVTPAAGLYELTASCRDLSDLSTRWQEDSNIRLTVNAALPSVTTSAATGVTTTEATLNGEVNANDDSTTATATFEYGLSSLYGTTVTADESPVTGTTPTPVSYTLSGLSPNTTYHYRAVATNSAGTIYGASLTFTTVCLSAIEVTSADDSGPGTLRQAITDVCSGGTITFNDDMTITLGSELAINASKNNLTITGAGHSITVSGNHVTRVFNVIAQDITFDTLTIADGNVSDMGGGIFHADGRSLTVTNSTFSGNRVSNGEGGAIYNTGISSLTITDSTFSGNSAYGNGGAIYNISGPQTVTNSTFSGNNSVSGKGGGIFSIQGPLTVTNSTFSVNSAALGGGIYCPELTVINSIFSGNSAANGGGIYSNYTFAILKVTNSTFSGNSTNNGGGIYNNGGDVTVTNSTFFDNRAGLGGGNIYSIGTATIKNTLIANITGENCHGAITDGGGNLQFGGTTVNSCGTSIPTADPLLGVLGNYGGTTQTFPLLPGSPAIDSGLSATCAAAPVNNLDQRGVTRPAACDIGAFESQGFSLSVASGEPQTTWANEAFADPLIVSISAIDPLEPVEGGLVSFTAPASGASASLTGSPAAISGGAARVTATANGTSGPYSVSAAASGATSNAVFALTNQTPPTLTTLAAGSVTTTSAILNATANASGIDTTVSFDYGLDTSYGASVNAVPNLVSGSTDTPVSAELSGLAPNSTYHFRAIGTNTAGTLDGGDLSFTTPCASAITVTSADDSGPGTLRQAIAGICANGTITFDDDYTITLSSELSITKNMTLSGSGHNIVISGQNAVRVFNIGSVIITLDTLTIANGRADDGGGVFSLGYLTIKDCTFSGNRTNGISSSPYQSSGGAILSLTAYPLSILNSTFINNQALKGGGIYSDSPLTIRNSTFSGNSADNGGGIFATVDSSFEHCTFSGNRSAAASGGIGGGILIAGIAEVELRNTVIANSTGPDCSLVGANIFFAGYNLIEDGSCDAAVTGDPLLSPLGNYGGSTQTFALLPGSPAIDIPSGWCTSLVTDQRGINRVGNCDLGAFESQGFSLSVDSGNDQTANLNSPFGSPLVVGVTANAAIEPVNGGQVSFTAPGSGASASLTGSPAAISGGAASVTATANGTSGPYSVNASTRGAPINAVFALINQTPPSLTTLAADHVTATSATLNATANASGNNTTITFEYGLDTSYGTSVNAVPNLVSGSTDTPVSAALSGLTTHTPYHFRAVANNSGGTVYGADQTFTPQPSDFGDLPESYGTSLSANGPYHRIPSSPVLYLGTSIDAEVDGAPSAGASSDDLTNLDDEDGVSLIDPESWMPGALARLSVTSSAPGFLNGWIDFNQNGSFDAMEHILTDQPISSGLNNLTFIVPLIAPATISTGLPARFRVASIPGILNPTGPAVDGEVEDYIFRNQTLSINDITLDEGDSGTSILTFTVSLSVPAPTGGVTFDITTADGTATTAGGDYSTKSLTSQSIPAGSSTYTFEVSILGDTAPEADEIFLVNITNVTNATVTDGQGTGTITNDDWVGSLVTTIHNGSVHTPISSANLKDSLHAAVNITGSGPVPSGSVAFIAYANPYCGGSGASAGTLTLDSSGLADPSASFLLTLEGLSFRAHYNGDTNYPSADGLCTPISTSLSPTVLALSANANPKDGDHLTASPASLIVQFNQDVLYGDSDDADSADNPDNYLLVEAGSNGTFDTTACGGTLGGLQQDDTPVTINAITYNPATFTAAISYNGGAPLSVGQYLLFICGTTSISDPTRTIYLNNELDDSRVRFDIQPSDPVTETVKILPDTGFAPNQSTFLPFQPLEKRYTAQGMELEIPSLGVKQAIVGVPGPEWNVSWLGNQIGYLQGTAFPTWNGNSVLAAHATNALGNPGPFANLGSLAWGDQLIIHAWGQRYIYEVRSVNLWTSPNATDALSQDEELPWLTLITCHGYDKKTNTYRWRTVVRAVLVEVE